MDTHPSQPDEQNRRATPYVLLAVGCILMALAFLMGINDNPPAIISMLIGFLAIVLGLITLFARSGNRKPAQQLLYWTPRALTISYAVFISLFALDVFQEGQGFFATVLALVMHLVPTFLILILLAVSWRREWIGGILFFALGVTYIVWAWNKPFGVFSTFVIMVGPLFLTGILFLLNWRYRAELRGSST